MIPENMTLDELIGMAAHSPDPLTRELGIRMTPPASYCGDACSQCSVRGLQIRDIIERNSIVVIRFMGGRYLVIEGEPDAGEVLYSMGRPLTKSERFDLDMMTEPERSEYLAELKARQDAARNRRIGQLKKELAELENQVMATETGAIK